MHFNYIKIQNRVMRLIFKDNLIVTNCKSPYYLQALINGEWVTVHMIEGENPETIEENKFMNTMVVNPDLFQAGETYDFKYLGSNGIESNIISILIPNQ